MTIKKDLKQLIRQRMEKYGEPYTVARRQVLSASGRLCPACHATLEERPLSEMPDLDDDELDDLTDGQRSDYFMALESNDPSDWGAWTEGVVEVFCPKCEARAVTPVEELMEARRRSGRREE